MVSKRTIINPELRLLYTKSNRLIRLFYHCSTDVKIALFRSYCTCFYCPFLWTHYKKSAHSKLRGALLLLLLFASIGALFSPGFLGLKSLTP